MASAYVGGQLLELTGRPSASAGGVLRTPAKGGDISIHICRPCRLYEQQGISYRLLDVSRLAKPGVARLRGLSPLAYFRLVRDAGLVGTPAVVADRRTGAGPPLAHVLHLANVSDSLPSSGGRHPLSAVDVLQDRVVEHRLGQWKYRYYPLHRLIALFAFQVAA